MTNIIILTMEYIYCNRDKQMWVAAVSTGVSGKSLNSSYQHRDTAAYKVRSSCISVVGTVILWLHIQSFLYIRSMTVTGILLFQQNYYFEILPLLLLIYRMSLDRQCCRYA